MTITTRTRPGRNVGAHRPRPAPGRRIVVDSRIDERRRTVRRRHSRRRSLMIGALVVVSLLGAGAWPLLHSRLFSATSLVVTGNRHTSSSAVLRAAGLAGHPPLIDVNGAAAARAVEALPWVATARVKLDWPDGAVVELTERTAVAALHGTSGWAELDRTGRVLAIVAVRPSGLVHLVGVTTKATLGSTLSALRPVLTVAARLPVAFGSSVDAVAPSPGGGVDLALAGGVGVVFGAPTQLPAKFEDIASVLAGAAPAPGSVIDVSVPGSPVVAQQTS
ncbi:MAG: cell division protein FtsQ/DivIB [Acidimicrobiales bacterium]